MSELRDDLIFQMLQETFAPFEEGEAVPVAPKVEQLSSDISLYYDLNKRFIQYKEFQIPANFGPFKQLTERGTKEVFVRSGHDYYEAMCVIFDNRASGFHFYWQDYTLWLHFETQPQPKAA